VSVAALRPAATVFREEQNFAWWVYALLAAMFVSTITAALWRGGPLLPSAQGWSIQAPVTLLVGLGLPSVLVLGVLRMTTEVTPTDCRVWFGWLPTYRQSVPLSALQRVEVVNYRPLRDCGGWGIRRGRGGERVLSARGDRGVRLHLADGSRLLIGSQRPEELAQALEQAMRPVV
jgi:hypothetical protein